MTYEGLQAKIDNVGHAVEYGHGIETSRIVKQLSALCAVVELHKAYELVTGWGTHTEPRRQTTCLHCEVVYPCPTIQTIEKELK